jgi:hypothetical protein
MGERRKGGKEERRKELPPSSDEPHTISKPSDARPVDLAANSERTESEDSEDDAERESGRGFKSAVFLDRARQMSQVMTRPEGGVSGFVGFDTLKCM